MAQASSPILLFVYGTLMAEEIVSSLLGLTPPHRAASVHGFARCCIDGQLYPALCRSSNPAASVNGRLYQLDNDQQLALLDDFEDVEYTREKVEVTVGESGETLTAYIYLWRDESDPRLVHGKDWDYGGWREKWLSHFAPMVKGWSEWYRNEQKGEFVFGTRAIP